MRSDLVVVNGVCLSRGTYAILERWPLNWAEYADTYARIAATLDLSAPGYRSRVHHLVLLHLIERELLLPATIGRPLRYRTRRVVLSSDPKDSALPAEAPARSADRWDGRERRAAPQINNREPRRRPGVAFDLE